MRTCTKCGTEKPLTEFNFCKSGGRFRRRVCKGCQGAAEAKRGVGYRLPRKAQKRQYDAIRYATRADQKKQYNWDFYNTRLGLAKYLCGNAKLRASKRGLPFDLTPEYIESIMPPQMVCPVLGITMERNRGRSRANSPTLDRIAPDRGYVMGNVIVISHRANSIKSDATAQEIERVAEWIKKQLPPEV